MVSPGRPARAGPGRTAAPVAVLGTVALGCVVVGGVYLAASLPRPVPLAPAVALLAAAGILLASSVALLVRLPGFAWRIFSRVAGWALLAYLVIAGMLEFVFVLDHVRGALLAVMTLMLAVFALDIPMLLAFSVARYADSGSGSRNL